MDLAKFFDEKAAWSRETFGPGRRTAGVIDHIKKELAEIEADPGDVHEWCDVVLLAMDGAARAGFTGDDFRAALVAKQLRNTMRSWPDWRTMPSDKAIEHDRGGEMATKKRGRFTKWRISDVLEAVALERGSTHDGGHLMTRGEYAQEVIEDARKRAEMPSADFISEWWSFIPKALGLAPITSGDSAAVERIASILVAEARRLNVPMRAR